ncbi:MAG TPA: hypothetical protein VNO30_16215 [Kofleriaceae bacterium]|nr:hypothetical protein [Kofleriaceae bacterium]
MFAFALLLAAAAVALDVLIFLVGLRDPRQYELASYVLLGLFAGWPWWRSLSPRPITALRVIAACAGWIGLCLTMTGIVDRDPARQGYALHAYGLVALALHAEIAGAILDRRDHGSALVPRVRWLRRRDHGLFSRFFSRFFSRLSRRSHARAPVRARARRADRFDPSIDAPSSLPLP